MYSNCTSRDRRPEYACCASEIPQEPDYEIVYNNSDGEEVSESSRIRTLFRCLNMMRDNKTVSGITFITHKDMY